ncbi:MAG: thiamine phosphate synthase [Roseburia sp.]|nr:thiamine phosphate synthase [Roseburia sp.]
MANNEIIAVTSRKLCTRPFLEQLERVAGQHPKAIMLREKDLPEETYERLAGEVLTLCRNYDVELILHNFPAVAKKLGIRTVHLPLGELRKFRDGGGAVGICSACFPGKAEGRRGDGLNIGCSVHSPEEAKEAEQLGAAYLTAGHIYATDCKPDIPPRGLSFLREVCRSVTIPVYAIGGIGLKGGRLEEVMEAGAKGACVMSDFMRV